VQDLAHPGQGLVTVSRFRIEPKTSGWLVHWQDRLGPPTPAPPQLDFTKEGLGLGTFALRSEVEDDSEAPRHLQP
jgi:hypothetical protein